jgi:hypothetical protein
MLVKHGAYVALFDWEHVKVKKRVCKGEWIDLSLLG